MDYEIRISALDIANFFGLQLFGENLLISKVKSIDSLEDNAIAFSKEMDIKCNYKALIIVPKNVKFTNSVFSYICVDRPRLFFAKVLNRFFCKKIEKGISLTSKIGNNCILKKNISIGENCIIGNNVCIGSNTIINNNVIIYDNTLIGENCYIKSGAIIGEDGFGFDFEDDGTPVRIPHIGAVKIGNNVEVGAKNTIARGTLGLTVIEDFVKLDDQVHVAHNCTIGKNTIITACTEVSGSVIIGENCWIGPNSSIIQKVKIGDSVTIGIGSIVTKDIENNKKIMGLESLDLKSLVKVKKKIGYRK